MKIKCSKCAKEFNIPDERLPMGQKIAFPCPVCKGLIELDLRQKVSENKSSPSEKPREEHLSGDALKKKILHNVKDLPPMPQTVLKAREIIDCRGFPTVEVGSRYVRSPQHTPA